MAVVVAVKFAGQEFSCRVESARTHVVLGKSAVRDKIRVDLAVSADEQSIKVVVKDRRIDVHSAGVHEPKVIVLEAHVPPTVMGAVCLIVVERVVGVFQMDCVEVNRAPLGALDQNSRPCILVRVVWNRALKNDGKVFGAFSH